ncbi:MAG TPA: aldo/keto reductase [Chitinophagaceae bacterium]|nr:aldo/keto reductase [Chitinophagaceae bacterium]
MEYRQLGASGVSVSAISFGAWAIGGWMWGGANRQEAIQAIRTSIDEGVTSIDTAPAYGQGLSEELVGEAIKDIPRDQVQVMTKFGLRWDTTEGEFFFSSADNEGKPIQMHKYAGKAGIIKECEDSLRRLRTDYIDLYQIHWHDSTTPISETMETLAQLQKEGKIRAAGVCNYTSEQMEEAGHTISLASNQVPYSMILRDIEKDLVPYCAANDKALIVYSPLQRGLLTGKIKKDHQFNEGDSRAALRFYTPESIEKVNSFLDLLRPLAREKGASLAQLVLRWTIDQPHITVALAGARNAQQAGENAKAGNIHLTTEELDFITKTLANAGY